MGRLYSNDGTLVFEGEFVDDVPLLEEIVEEQVLGIETNTDSLQNNGTETAEAVAGVTEPTISLQSEEVGLV
jgi:hypothetical protein